MPTDKKLTKKIVSKKSSNNKNPNCYKNRLYLRNKYF